MKNQLLTQMKMKDDLEKSVVDPNEDDAEKSVVDPDEDD